MIMSQLYLNYVPIMSQLLYRLPYLHIWSAHIIIFCYYFFVIIILFVFLEYTKDFIRIDK